MKSCEFIVVVSQIRNGDSRQPTPGGRQRRGRGRKRSKVALVIICRTRLLNLRLRPSTSMTQMFALRRSLSLYSRALSSSSSPQTTTIGRLFSTSSPHRSAGGALDFNGHSYPYVWLRDSCQCPSCLQPSTRQKLHASSDVPLDVKPATDGVHATPDGLWVTWTSGHQSHYSRAFLERYASTHALHVFHRDVHRVEWNVPQIRKSRRLFLPYDALQTPSGLLAAITQLTQYGLLFVTSVPNTKTSNEECELRALGERFGELRRTFYGETWDVKNVKNSRNIAYTNVNLGLHMDLL